MKQLLILGLFAAMVFGLTSAATAQATVPDVRGLQPFTAETNYMSLPGFLRWQYYQETASWITWGEAVALVRSQLVIAAAPLQ